MRTRVATLVLLSSPLPRSLLPPLLCSMAEDLASASEAVVVVRRERLRALYAAERVQFQTELRARGLAMQTAE